MKGFEKYLRENKEQLNLEAINPETWLVLENKLLKRQQRKQAVILRWMGSAAAIFLALILIWNYSGLNSNSPMQILAEHGLDNEEFTAQVAVKRAALTKAQIPTDRKEDFDLLLKQLAFLDAQYDDYLQYVAQNGYQEFIGQQIINYYKTKIELLDKIQQEIEKINYYEKKYDKESPKTKLSL